MTSENYVKFRFSYVRIYWNTATLICLHIVSGCSHFKTKTFHGLKKNYLSGLMLKKFHHCSRDWRKLFNVIFSNCLVLCQCFESRIYTANMSLSFSELSTIRSSSPTLLSLFVCLIPFIVFYYCFHLVP